jgi:hypothetical protein
MICYKCGEWLPDHAQFCVRCGSKTTPTSSNQYQTDSWPSGIPNYYATLGLRKNAQDSEVKPAWRREAKKWHPDVYPDKQLAHEQFIRIQEAYEILSDTTKRKQYDLFVQAASAREAQARQFVGQARQEPSYTSSQSTYSSSQSKMDEWLKEARNRGEEYIRNPQSFWDAVGVKHPAKFGVGVILAIIGLGIGLLITVIAAPYLAFPIGIAAWLTRPLWMAGFNAISNSFKE